MINFILFLSICINLFVVVMHYYDKIKEYVEYIKKLIKERKEEKQKLINSRKFKPGDNVWMTERQMYGKIDSYNRRENNYDIYKVKYYDQCLECTACWFEFFLEKVEGDDIPPFPYIWKHQGRMTFRKNGWK